MCLIIHKLQGKKLPKELYERAMKEHEDGAGVAFVDEEKRELHIEKGFFKFESFWEYLEPREDMEMIIHFRNASAGTPINPQNCHPFYIDSSPLFMFDKGGKQFPKYQFAVAHNGRLEWRTTKTKSDTYCFIDDYLGRHLSRDPYFLDQDYGIPILERVVAYNKGSWTLLNKLAIFQYEPEANLYSVHIIHEDKWEKAHGCLFSNTSYLPRLKTTYCKGGYGGDEAGYEDYSRLGEYFAGNAQWQKPDKFGWKWSYEKDMWYNIHTKEFADILTSRPLRPEYMATAQPYRPKKDNPIVNSGTEPIKEKQQDLPISEGSQPRLPAPKDIEAKIVAFNAGTPVGPKVVTAEKDKKRVTRISCIRDASEINLMHLTLVEEALLKKAAALYVKNPATGFSDVKCSVNQAIGCLRQDVRKYVPGYSQATDPCIDHVIISKISKKIDITDWVLTEMVKAQEELTKVEAEQAVKADELTVEVK